VAHDRSVISPRQPRCHGLKGHACAHANNAGRRWVSTGVLTGQIVLVFAIASLGVSIATQWTAAALGYQLRLGAPWFLIFGTPVYYPWRLFQWWYFYNAYAPEIFLRGGAIAACSGITSAGAAVAASVWRSRQSRLVTTYGS